jgi:two-component system OmpR family sensor kinase
MKLQTRLTVTTAILIGVATLVGGGAAAFSSFQSELATAENSLNQEAASIAKAKGQELPTALLIGSANPTGMGVSFVDINGDYSILQDGPGLRSSKPSVKILTQASVAALQRTSPSHLGYLLRTVALPDSEYVVLTLSTDQIRTSYANSLRVVFGFSGLAVVLACGFVWFFIRRDLRGIRRLISQAKDIAGGNRKVFDAQENAERSFLGTDEVALLSQSLAKMVQELQANQLEMRRFLGDASHELRTPLTVIRGYLELLDDPRSLEDKSFAPKAVSKMSHEVLRMQKLIDDLLLLAELGATSELQSVKKVDFESLVNNELENLHNLQPRRPVTELLEAVSIYGDEALLSQLLANLFGNLRRHTSSTDAVEIHLLNRGTELVLTCDDAGPGLAPEAYQRGINGFERFDPSRSRANGGSGLGMSLMAGIVGKHGGSINLSPSKLGGLRTEIHLPTAHIGT